MLHKKIEGDELYLYMNGKLIYKRWLKTGVSKVFDLFAYDKYTLTSINDLQFENLSEKISIKAKLKLNQQKTVEGIQESKVVTDQIMSLNIEVMENYTHIWAKLYLKNLKS